MKWSGSQNLEWLLWRLEWVRGCSTPTARFDLPKAHSSLRVGIGVRPAHAEGRVGASERLLNSRMKLELGELWCLSDSRILPHTRPSLAGVGAFKEVVDTPSATWLLRSLGSDLGLALARCSHARYAVGPAQGPLRLLTVWSLC